MTHLASIKKHRNGVGLRPTDRLHALRTDADNYNVCLNGPPRRLLAELIFIYNI